MNEMDNHALLAVSPIDGRYSRQTEPLREYFSEYALIKYRVRIEIEYFIALCELPIPQLEGMDKTLFPRLRDIYKNEVRAREIRTGQAWCHRHGRTKGNDAGMFVVHDTACGIRIHLAGILPLH